MKLIFLFTLLMIVFDHSAVSAKQYLVCDAVLNEDFDKLSHTQQFTTYLDKLFEDRVFTVKDLEKFISSLERQQKVTNPLSPTSSSRLIQTRNLQDHIDHTELNFDETMNWAQEKMTKYENAKTNKEKIEQKTKKSYIEMKFFPIRARTFQITDSKDRVTNVTLTNDFEMTQTPVTQAMWVELMKIAPKAWRYAPINSDLPATLITWWSAAEFANRLSKKMGLKEVYDFSDVIFKENTSAEEGNLDIVSGVAKINGSIVYDKFNGPSVYETVGYRLPTFAEQKLVLNYLAQAAGVTPDNISEFGWFSKNPQRKLQPVMEKKGIIIEGNVFFDLIGNVFQWSDDNEYSLYDYANNQACTNPSFNPRSKSKKRFVMGGSHLASPDSVFDKFNISEFPDRQSSDIGFRLVRSLIKP